MKRLLGAFALLLAIGFWGGCGRLSPPPVTTLQDADKKFITICQEELSLSPILIRAPQTLWIYFPMEIAIVTTSASRQGAQPSTNQATTGLSLRYLDTSYQDGTFNVEYDIAETKKYAKDYGYSSITSEEYQQLQRNILNAIQRAYVEVEQKDETTGTPDFFVTIVADIINGLEVETILYFPDLKKILSPVAMIPAEEASSRFLVELRGNPAIKGDKDGRHIQPKTITFPDFLARQITNRVNMKYQTSLFPPSDKSKEEILRLVKETLDLYGFKDFSSVALHDLEGGTREVVTVEELEEYKSELPPGGKYHVINFF